MARRGALLCLIAVGLLVGCNALRILRPAPTPPPPKPAQIVIANQTALALMVVVNDANVAEVPAMSGDTLHADRLPPLPWLVVVKTTAGRVLASFVVHPADLEYTLAANGGIESTIPGARVDLSCGTLRMWAGDAPMSGPIPGPGTPGDCEP